MLNSISLKSDLLSDKPSKRCCFRWTFRASNCQYEWVKYLQKHIWYLYLINKVKRTVLNVNNKSPAVTLWIFNTHCCFWVPRHLHPKWSTNKRIICVLVWVFFCENKQFWIEVKISLDSWHTIGSRTHLDWTYKVSKGSTEATFYGGFVKQTGIIWE